ncbi:dTDP-glucose 4,6-dehydratase [Candidatus Uhrbacteria bacterium]|nr:dTDP-glucose 4,6-dehydratase [Candidatus Uhrbacteria bacterium]
MRLLITGGAGFMGSNFIRYLIRTYPTYEIINFDKLTYAGNLENLKEVENNPRYQFVRGDISDADAVSVAIRGVDAVVNFAAETHVDRSIMDPTAFIRTDIFGTYTLLEAVKKYGVGRMIQISTDEVYGSVAEGEADESHPFEPNSPYSASKAGGDHLCRAYVKTYGTPVIVTHGCNFYGPNQYPEKFIPLFVTNLIEGKKVPLYGDGRNIREWIYTEDHCRAVDRIVHDGKLGEVYNIGSGERYTNIEVVEMILQEFGGGDEMIEYVQDRPGHDRRYALDSSKIRRELGWNPEVSFRDGLTKTIAWYKENQVWWKKLKSGEYLEYYMKLYGG